VPNDERVEGSGVVIVVVFVILFWLLRALFSAADQSK
jgi:hypothetical protein